VRSDQCIIRAVPPQTQNNIQFLPNAPDERCLHYCYVYKQPETVDELQRLLEAVCFSCVEAIRDCGIAPSFLWRFGGCRTLRRKENICFEGTVEVFGPDSPGLVYLRHAMVIIFRVFSSANQASFRNRLRLPPFFATFCSLILVRP
jgi:hypothetical protein